LVALNSVETFGCATQSSEYIATTDDYTYFYAHIGYFLDLGCIFAGALGVYSILLLAHERLATQLEQDAFEFSLHTNY
jgi:hypothetical protein